MEDEEGYEVNEDDIFNEEAKKTTGESSFGVVLNYIIFGNPLSKYVIVPTFSLTGKVLSYVIPKSVKKIPSFIYWKLAGSYASADFANLLLDMKIVQKDTWLNFAQEYFNDAIEEAFEENKLVLVIYADMNDVNSGSFLMDLFASIPVVDILAEHYIIFGVDHGTQEAQHLSNEFGIT